MATLIPTKEGGVQIAGSNYVYNPPVAPPPSTVSVSATYPTSKGGDYTVRHDLPASSTMADVAEQEAVDQRLLPEIAPKANESVKPVNRVYSIPSQSGEAVGYRHAVLIKEDVLPGDATDKTPLGDKFRVMERQLGVEPGRYIGGVSTAYSRTQQISVLSETPGPAFYPFDPSRITSGRPGAGSYSAGIYSPSTGRLMTHVYTRSVKDSLDITPISGVGISAGGYGFNPRGSSGGGGRGDYLTGFTLNPTATQRSNVFASVKSDITNHQALPILGSIDILSRGARDSSIAALDRIKYSDPLSEYSKGFGSGVLSITVGLPATILDAGAMAKQMITNPATTIVFGQEWAKGIAARPSYSIGAIVGSAAGSEWVISGLNTISKSVRINTDVDVIGSGSSSKGEYAVSEIKQHITVKSIFGKQEADISGIGRSFKYAAEPATARGFSGITKFEGHLTINGNTQPVKSIGTFTNVERFTLTTKQFTDVSATGATKVVKIDAPSNLYSTLNNKQAPLGYTKTTTPGMQYQVSATRVGGRIFDARGVSVEITEALTTAGIKSTGRTYIEAGSIVQRGSLLNKIFNTGYKGITNVVENIKFNLNKPSAPIVGKGVSVGMIDIYGAPQVQIQASHLGQAGASAASAALIHTPKIVATGVSLPLSTASTKQITKTSAVQLPNVGGSAKVMANLDVKTVSGSMVRVGGDLGGKRIEVFKPTQTPKGGYGTGTTSITAYNFGNMLGGKTTPKTNFVAKAANITLPKIGQKQGQRTAMFSATKLNLQTNNFGGFTPPAKSGMLYFNKIVPTERGKGFRFKAISFKAPSGYTPSVAAIALDVRSSMPKAATSGLTLRPILGSSKKRRRRK